MILSSFGLLGNENSYLRGVQSKEELVEESLCQNFPVFGAGVRQDPIRQKLTTQFTNRITDRFVVEKNLSSQESLKIGGVSLKI
jgi:hypothetical protein